MKSGLFVKLDINYLDDEQILSVSAEAEAVFIRSVALSKRRASDGRISRPHVRLLTDRCSTPAEELIAELVDAGLWTEDGAGWLIPSFLKHNQSAAQIEQAREAETARKASARANRSVRPDTTARPEMSGRTNPDTTARPAVSVTTESESESETKPAAEPEAPVPNDRDRTIDLLLARRRSQQQTAVTEGRSKPITNVDAWQRAARTGLLSEHGDRIDADLAAGFSPDTIARSLIPLPTDRIPAGLRQLI